MALRFGLFEPVMSELAICAESSLPISLEGFFLSSEYAEMLVVELCSPAFAAFTPIDSGESGCVGAHESFVPGALCIGGKTEVDPTVIASDGIDMVDFSGWPFASHIEPSQYVGEVFVMIYADPDITSIMRTSGSLPSLGQLFELVKPPIIWVVAPNLAQMSVREHISGSHALLSISREWSGAAGGREPLVAPSG